MNESQYKPALTLSDEDKEIINKISIYRACDILRSLAEQLSCRSNPLPDRMTHGSDLIQSLYFLEKDKLEQLTFLDLQKTSPKTAEAMFCAIFYALRLGAQLPHDILMTAERRAAVNLSNSSGIGLIVPAATTIYYTTKVGGSKRYDVVKEGFYVPLSIKEDEALELKSLFIEGDQTKWDKPGISDKTARFIDYIFENGDFTVNAGRLIFSCEQWIYVTLERINTPTSLVSTKGKPDAILTWTF